MNNFFVAQRELSRSVIQVHESLALNAMQDLGADVDEWSDVLSRADEMQNIIDEYQSRYDLDELDIDEKEKIEGWGLGTVRYDADPERPYHKVPLLGSVAVRLVQSSSPGDEIPFVRPGSVNNDLLYPSNPHKFIQIQFKDFKRETKDGIVMIGPDMPAVAVHGDDIRYVVRNTDTPEYWAHGTAFLDGVEAAFGSTALEQLSAEACIALSGVIRNSHAELENSENRHSSPIIS